MRADAVAGTLIRPMPDSRLCVSARSASQRVLSLRNAISDAKRTPANVPHADGQLDLGSVQHVQKPVTAQPQTIDDFRIVRELGRGGMGVVYEAVEEPLGRRVALKLLHPSIAESPAMAARFLEEARAIARLSHPGIVKVHRIGRSGDAHYLALEYVDGRPLDQVLAESHFGLERARKVLTAIARALGHAHAAGLVHRDVKPANVFMRANDEVVLGDFGLAKDLASAGNNLTRTGTIMGTPAYMSPEQAQGHKVTAATDVYALGVMAFEMFAGRVPFTADSAMTLLYKHVNEPPPSLREFAPDTPAEAVAAVVRMLEKDPARRPPHGDAAAALLDGVGQGGADEVTTTLQSIPAHAPAAISFFEELEVTVAAFDLQGFAKITVQSVLPARAAFLLESWFRLVKQAIGDQDGTVDRLIADRVIALFGYPQPHADHSQRALRAGVALVRALAEFNRAHGLALKMRCGIATGSALVGRVQGDYSPISVQGPLMGDMHRLSKTRQVDLPLRLNRAAYRRCYKLADFTQYEDPEIGEAWAAGGAPLPATDPGSSAPA